MPQIINLIRSLHFDLLLKILSTKLINKIDKLNIQITFSLSICILNLFTAIVVGYFKIIKQPQSNFNTFRISNNNYIMSQGLVLPRMKATKNREVFFMKKKKEIEESLTVQQPHQEEKYSGDFIAFYLKTLNKIKRSKRKVRSFQQPMQTQSIIHHETIAPETSIQTNYKTFIDDKKKKNQFSCSKSETRRRSFNYSLLKPQSQTLQVTISNGNMHDKIVPEKSKKQNKFDKMAQFKKLREKKSLTFRIIQSKTSRGKQRSTTIQDISFQDVISKTKYLNSRQGKTHFLQDFQNNSNFANKIKLLTPRKDQTTQKSESSLQVNQVLKTQQEVKYQQLERKYKSLMQGFTTAHKISSTKNSLKQKKKKPNILNTFQLTGW